MAARVSRRNDRSRHPAVLVAGGIFVVGRSSARSCSAWRVQGFPRLAALAVAISQAPHIVAAVVGSTDGGWPITWEPPSEASALEWRGVATLKALLTLRSYGRLSDD